MIIWGYWVCVGGWRVEQCWGNFFAKPNYSSGCVVVQFGFENTRSKTTPWPLREGQLNNQIPLNNEIPRQTRSTIWCKWISIASFISLMNCRWITNCEKCFPSMGIRINMCCDWICDTIFLEKLSPLKSLDFPPKVSTFYEKLSTYAKVCTFIQKFWLSFKSLDVSLKMCTLYKKS